MIECLVAAGLKPKILFADGGSLSVPPALEANPVMAPLFRKIRVRSHRYFGVEKRFPSSPPGTFANYINFIL